MTMPAVPTNTGVTGHLQKRLAHHYIKEALENAGNPETFEAQGLTVEKYKSRLENAFGIARANESYINGESYPADVMYRYARTLYNADYPRCHAMLMGSFLQQERLFNDWAECSSLKDLTENLLAQRDVFVALVDQQLKLSNPACFAEKVADAFPEEKILLANTLRWLGYCLMNLDEFSSHTEENNLRLKTVYKFAKAILEPMAVAGDTEAIKELGELIYNIAPGIHQRKHPGDVLGAMAKLDKVLQYDESPAMRARIANKKACSLPVKEAVHWGEEALRLWTKEVNPEEVDPFLLANCRNTVARLWMSYGDDNDYPRIEELLDQAVAHAEECQSQGKDHYYFAIYFINYGGFELMRNNLDEAQKWIEKAEANINAFPKSSAQLRENLQRVKLLWSLVPHSLNSDK